MNGRVCRGAIFVVCLSWWVGKVPGGRSFGVREGLFSLDILALV